VCVIRPQKIVNHLHQNTRAIIRILATSRNRNHHLPRLVVTLKLKQDAILTTRRNILDQVHQALAQRINVREKRVVVIALRRVILVHLVRQVPLVHLAVRQVLVHLAVRQVPLVHLAVRQVLVHLAVRQVLVHLAVRQALVHLAVRQAPLVHLAVRQAPLVHLALVVVLVHPARQVPLVHLALVVLVNI
jgi:hypothetical protein